jgi:hypothetical protein
MTQDSRSRNEQAAMTVPGSGTGRDAREVPQTQTAGR